MEEDSSITISQMGKYHELFGSLEVKCLESERRALESERRVIGSEQRIIETLSHITGRDFQDAVNKLHEDPERIDQQINSLSYRINSVSSEVERLGKLLGESQ